MKIAFLLQDTRSLYGAEQATVQLLAGLTAAGLAAHVVLLQETRLGAGGSPLADALLQVAPVHSIPVAGRFSRSAVAQIREIMARERCDVLHSTGYKADWHALLASRRASLFPVVSTVHGWLFRWQPKERFFQALNIRALRQFSRVVVLSQFYERYLRRCGLGPLQLAHIPTGICPERVVGRAVAQELWNAPGEMFTFGMLGRLSSEKDHRLLLRAVRRLARDLDTSPRSWRILIAGDGPLRGALQRQIARWGLRDRVELAGWLPAAEFFARTHVLVQCSRVENQPLSVMEAMAWMRPVLATRAGGLPELVADGETGALVRRSARALAAAMRHYLAAPTKARADGIRARDRLEQQYAVEPMIRDHIGLYATVRASWNTPDNVS